MEKMLINKKQKRIRDSQTRSGRDAKKANLTKVRKLKRAMIAHVLVGSGTINMYINFFFNFFRKTELFSLTWFLF